MDPQFAFVSREDIWRLHEDMKTVQSVQGEHSDRLSRLERRQEDDARLKSVWGTSSPFPGVLSGTPQQGTHDSKERQQLEIPLITLLCAEPVHNPPGGDFKDFDESHQHNLLGSLQLDQDEEPRRGASRANSVRFDESAKHGHWPRSSGEFFPIRTGSGLGSHPMTERSLSHKSDGRQSSAGQSIHSAVSAHSARTNSLGLDASFPPSQPPSTPFDTAGPPPGLFILGAVPSIIRCWLDTNFTHDTLLYAVVCPGSYLSFLDLDLIERLDLKDQVSGDGDGEGTIKLPVYLPEAVVQQPPSRSNSPAPQLPTLTVSFRVTSRRPADASKAIQIFLGSDMLRAHNADILLSQNSVTLFGDDHSKLSVPLVRPEDDGLFKNLRTVNGLGVVEAKLPLLPKKATLHAHSTGPTTSSSVGSRRDNELVSSGDELGNDEYQVTSPSSPLAEDVSSDLSMQGVKLRSGSHGAIPNGLRDTSTSDPLGTRNVSNAGSTGGRSSFEGYSDESQVDRDNKTGSETVDPSQKETSGGIWGSWRREQGSKADAATTSTPSGSVAYQRANRGRGMKVLRPAKSSISTPRSVTQPTSGAEGDHTRAKSDLDPTGPMQSQKVEGRKLSPTGEGKVPMSRKEQRSASGQPRTANPVGGASAFAWLNGSGGQHKRSATLAE
ncbi:MAG: hypothetical protein M1832_000242 [Thelocarpon impressellum]|nr:MAG: hypothetical protein M1832_000242 [Thelocarpon impressellum]